MIKYRHIKAVFTKISTFVKETEWSIKEMTTIMKSVSEKQNYGYRIKNTYSKEERKMENRIIELEKRIAELEAIIKNLCFGDGTNIVINGGAFGDIRVGEGSSVKLEKSALGNVYASDCESVTLNNCPAGSVINGNTGGTVDIDDISDRVDDVEDTLDDLEDKADEIEDLIDELDDKTDEIQERLDKIMERLDNLE